MSASRTTREPRATRVVVSNGYENIYVRGFCNGLSDDGVPFVLISSDRTDTAGLRAGTATVNLRGSQDENRPKRDKLFNMLRYHARLIAYVIRHRPQVTHLIGLLEPALLCGVIDGLLLRCFSGRYVLTVHDLQPHDHHTKWDSFVYGLSFRIAETLVVHTPRMGQQLVERYGVDAKRIVVMQHGIEPQRREAAVQDRPTTGDPLKILFFGKVLRYKGVDLLLSALENFPVPFELTIAGAASEDALRNELRAQIAAHPQRDRITWTDGFIPEAQIAPLFGAADVLLLPYRHIDQSGILFQSLRFGVPIVASRVGSLADYVSEEVGELCEPNDVADLRRALVRLQARVGGLSRARIANIAARYEWSRTVEPLRAVYGVPVVSNVLEGSL